MERRTAIRNLIVAGAVVFFNRHSAARDRDKEPDFIIHSETRLVLLDVSVKDRHGGFVYGLSKNDFQVEENGAQQNITVFTYEDLPVTVGILLDNSRSMIPKLNDVFVAADAFIQGSNPRDQIFVLHFSDDVKPGLPDDVLFSDNPTQLRAAILYAVPGGKTALNDAVIAGLRQLELGTRDKKTLVLISDGGDNASRHTRRQMFESVERSIATVYAIGLFAEGDREQDPGLLKELAHVSGGEVFFPLNPTALTSVCRAVAKDIRQRYTIGYVPPQNNGGPLRHIRVHVKAPGRAGLIARTRTSYLYDRATSQS